MARLLARFKLPDIDKSYVPIMASVSKWTLNSWCIPIRPESTLGEFTLIKNLRHKIIFYLSFSSYLFYVVTFDFWFYINFFGQSRPVWENLVLVCFCIANNIVGILQIMIYFRQNEVKQSLENSFLMEKRCLALGNGTSYISTQHIFTVQNSEE